MDPIHSFKQWKEQCLNKLDVSKKGSVDEAIVNVVGFINESDNFFTTSSCSGRIILIDGSDCAEVQKKTCSWLFVSHKKCQTDDVLSGLQKPHGDAVLKFEPFVLHVQCRQLEDARLLHSVAINSGFRNSGISVGKKGKIIMAVRSTHSLEVPLSHEGKLLVTKEYIDYLVHVSNLKMEENQRRIERFYSCLQSTMSAEHSVISSCRGNSKVNSMYTYRRKKKEKQSFKGKSRGEDEEPLEKDDTESALRFLMECT
ncbi:tRNA wybutosine-synthesizing protein 3 homolog [Latimeria chalumnae]|uniref:tRNA wybutosine-synthesizing protein 3 homolog n=1 Tax=Latimeria chalumnae TaxID=7897 RepID=H3AXI5_LATCH|nr:PREDICTED: tRNA wybutosine-synthesizing protein 3 homolog [Latimeria chalumnae]|eukprot:XP_006003353.1 PREDICTED: tRNA wybutosine-synthesizing protein 3 homolog [Latimeria chalumnae]